MLHIDLAVGDKLQIGGATVVLVEKSGRRARLSVSADSSIPVRLEHQPGPHHHAEQAPRRAGTKP